MEQNFFHFKTFDELLKPEPIRDGHEWGPWRLDAKLLTLTHIRGYEIDLERIHSSAEMLDWIFQVLHKIWCTPETTKGLLDAFDALFDPQANLCSMGHSKTINPTAHLRQKSPR